METRAFRIAAVCLAVFLATASAACDRKGTTAMFDAEVLRQIEAAVTGNLAFFGGREPVPGAVVGVWAPRRGSFAKGFGYADVHARRGMDARDRFRVGSNTKPFVVTVLLQLVDEGKLSLDDRLVKFDLGVDVPGSEKITVRQLCNMTSGLFDVYHAPQLDKMPITPHARMDPRRLVTLAVSNPPRFSPGEPGKYYYTNTGYLLLGLIIEAVTGNRVENEIRDRLLLPLALRSTIYPVNDPRMPEPHSRGYTLGPDRAWQDQTVLFHPSVAGAAGVMISNMEDMRKWVKAYVTGSTNSAASQKERLTCVDTGSPNLGFGLGIGCTGGWFGYTGGIPGYNTAAYYLPAEDATIIAFVNSQREKPAPGVANSIVRDITRAVFPKNVAFY